MLANKILNIEKGDMLRIKLQNLNFRGDTTTTCMMITDIKPKGYCFNNKDQFMVILYDIKNNHKFNMDGSSKQITLFSWYNFYSHDSNLTDLPFGLSDKKEIYGMFLSKI